MISCLSQSRLSVSHTTSSVPSLVFYPTFFNFQGGGTKFFHFFIIIILANMDNIVYFCFVIYH